MPSITRDMTMPPQKLMVLLKGVWSFLKPAKYATVMGKRDKEQGPKLVRSPPVKIISIETGLGLFRPLLISCSP